MQRRLFVFMILFVEDKARLLRFDTTGAVMAPDFDHAQRPEVIRNFLHRLSQNRAAIGHDPTAIRASNADTALFRNLHTHYHPASAVGRALRDASIEDWPVYKLCVEGCFSADGSMAVLQNSPVCRREYLIGRPTRTWIDLTGRSTRTYVAYNTARNQVVAIKDSWRPSSKDIRSEFDTYLLLYAAKLRPGQPFCIPTLLGGGDITWKDVIQETRSLHSSGLPSHHLAMGQQFLHALRAPPSHPAYGLPWPVGGKLSRAKLLDLVPSASVLRSKRAQVLH